MNATMMTTWLQTGAAWAWHTSLLIAVPALLLLALGRWRSFSARWRMVFAAALLLRLMLPWVPEMAWHPASSLERALFPAPAVKAVPPLQGDTLVALETAPSSGTAVPDAAPSAAAAAPFPWRELAAGLWALGVAGIAVWLVRSHWLIRRWVRLQGMAPDATLARLFEACRHQMGLRQRIGLRAMSHLPTAAVCGWLRPMVLVPANLRETHSEDEIRGILLHELAHVRRCDVLWSWLGLAACALHWFNPLAWAVLRRFHADRELDCDRLALQALSAPQRESYAPALFKSLDAAPQSSPPAAAAAAALVPFFRHKHEVHTRILAIMKPSRSLVARLAALSLVPALALLSLTRASADGEKPPGEEKGQKGDGEGGKSGPRDGEGDGKKTGPRDGEGGKAGPKDSEGRKSGMRDGEGRKTGPRDGENKGAGPRDGEGKKNGPRDGEGARKPGQRDGVGVRAPKTSSLSEATVLRILDKGETISIGDETFPIGRLRGYLNGLPNASELALVVRPDDDVPYKTVLEVLDAAKDNKVWNVSFATKERGGDGASKTRKPEER